MAKKDKILKIKGVGSFVVQTGGIERLEQFGKVHEAISQLQHIDKSSNQFSEVVTVMKQIHKLVSLCAGQEAAQTIFAPGKDEMTDYLRVFVLMADLFSEAFNQQQKELDSIQELIETA